MNSIVIAGNVGRDAVTRSTQSGESVTGFSVAVSEGKDQTTWFDCSLWGDRGEKLAQYITKGSKICVSGRVSARCHDDKAYLQVNVSQVTFMSSKGERDQANGGGSSSGSGYSGATQATGSSSKPSDLDDEIPF